MIAHLIPLLLCLASTRAPAQDSPEALIQKGRALLEQGDTQAALPLFEQAASQDGDKLRSRVWVLRAWIALGRTEDALGATDELKSKGEKGPELDYLYGMGFYDLALRAVQQGQTGAFTGQTFGDAVTFLDRALAADAQRFGDAWVPLAESAWYVPDLPKARAACEKAVAAAPTSVRALSVRGRVCMSQYVAEKDDPAQAALAEDAWKAAVDSYERAATELAKRSEANGRAELADARLQLGNALMWKTDKDKAAAAYTQAIAASPGTIDYMQIWRALGSAPFLKALDTARKSLHEGAGANELGTLAWWHGFAGYDLKQYAQAEADFRDALAKEPAFLNSWYYVFKCAYNQQQYAEAIDALKQFRAADAASLVSTLDGERELNLPTLEYLIGWCADGEKHGGTPANLDAAAVCEILTELDPKEPRHWNNLGLFVRDHGEALQRSKPDTDPAELAKYWERAMVAYETALAMSPEDPNYLNDTALLLHYHLKRDLERAKAMYQKAYAIADAQLQRKDLDPDARARLAIAKRDSKNNLELLEKELGKGSGG